MGQHISVGLMTDFNVDKSQTDSVNWDLDELKNQLRQQLHYVPELYNVIEGEGIYQFQLKEGLFATGLLPFLRAFYPAVYDGTDHSQKLIDKVDHMFKDVSPNGWMAVVKRQEEEAFRYDRYGCNDHLQTSGDGVFARRIRIRIHCHYLGLLLEGKVIMENWSRAFGLFDYAMRQTFKQHKLADALRTYITG